MFNTLAYLGEKLNKSNIVWGVGASILLNQFGFIDDPNDIDILVDINDIDRTDDILKSIGVRKKLERVDVYSTEYFYEYIINQVDVDVMAGLRINHKSGVFKYVFDYNSISEYRKINGIDIPFTSLEDWYVIYQLIPRRELKVNMIENYILSNGIKKPLLLERAVEGNLPIDVRDRVRKMLNIWQNTR